MKTKLASSMIIAIGAAVLPISAADVTWSGATDTTFLTGSNWVGGNAPTNDTTTDIGVFGSTITSNLPTLTANRSVAGLKFLSTTGGWTLNTGGFTLSLGTSGIDDSANIGGTTTINGTVSLAAGVTTAYNTGGVIDITTLNAVIAGGDHNMNVVGNGTVSVGNLASLGNGKFVKSGNGTLVIRNAAAVSMNDNADLNAGRVLIGNKSALGTGTITIASGSGLGSTVDLIGTDKIMNNITIAGNSPNFVGEHSLELGATLGRTSNGTGILTSNIDSAAGEKLILNNYQGIFLTSPTAATGHLDIGGAGDIDIIGVFSNGNATAANLIKRGSGTLTLTNNNTYSGSTTVNGSGRLVADYIAGGSVLTSGTALTLGGATIEFKGRTGNFTTSQTIGNITTTASTGLSQIVLNRNGGNGTAITAGTIVPSTTRSALLVDLGDSANSLTSTSDLTAGNTRLIVRDGAGKYDFGVNTGVGTAVLGMNSTTDLIANPATSANYRLTSSFTVTGSTNLANTVRIAPTENNQILTLDNGTAANNYRFNAMLFDSDQDFTIQLAAGKTGSLGNAASNGTNANFILYHTGEGKLTMDAKMAGGFNSASGSGTVELYGTGLIDWTRAASSNGTMTIGGTTLRQGSGNGMLTTNATTGLGSGNVALSDGGVWENSGGSNITRDTGTGSGQIQWLGDGGFSAFGGNRTVSLNSGGTLVWGTNIGDNKLVLGSKSSNARIDFQNALDLGTSVQRTVIVNNGVNTNDVDARLSGVLSGTGALHKTGDGVLEITNTNTYIGATYVSSGTLLVEGSIASGSSVYVAAGAVLGGNGTIHGNLNLATGAFLAFDTTKTLTINGDLTLHSSFGVDDLRTLHGEAINWSGISDNTYTLLETDFTFSASNISNFGLANAYDIGGGRVAYFQNGSLELVVATIPEPSTWALLGIGLGSLIVLRRRSKK